MKFESLDNSGETAMSIIFEPQEVPIISEIKTLYLDKEYIEDPDAYLASSIIFDSLEFYNDDTALRVDLGPKEQAVFIEKMSQASTLYLNNQLTRWVAKTAMYPSWLAKEKVGSTYSTSAAGRDELYSPQFLAHLDQQQAKLSDAKNVTRKFQKMANAINQ